ncbi:Cytochrome b561 eukaryote [Penicillium chermesinum]|uniref:Cytochrome b561 eukaryote n=1 Tax=Penicillium chermesinum TaxID=63820 RepID=A0A9W9P8Z6_9EURO|nr:Cytochrome b561 eukaryote [Penicillium chermesinum]KAJ5239726.1 Cytochrome b561 eukaryote [Penicillium chermesinum]KAJ6166609.1 Cytochrome b561 eukaryote [Penicillium chermesinum]
MGALLALVAPLPYKALDPRLLQSLNHQPVAWDLIMAENVPETDPAIVSRESEPLLGQPGDVTQRGERIAPNLITGIRSVERLEHHDADEAIGTATLAQLAIWIWAIFVWVNLLSDPIMLFTFHPILAITALLLQIQAALALQPTATPTQKHLGTRVHYWINLSSVLLFLAAFTVIEVNKGSHPHFVSTHGILGLLTVIFVVLQASFGVVQYFLPEVLLGSVDKGKRLYKYHRWTGYLGLVAFAIPAAVKGTQQWLDPPTWTFVVGVLAIVLGVGSRIKKHKLGL